MKTNNINDSMKTMLNQKFIFLQIYYYKLFTHTLTIQSIPRLQK